MDNIISESGMNFVADNAFYIEKCLSYENIKSDGIKSVEFIRAKDDKLLFIEAKKTFPNPGNPAADNPTIFQSEIDKICDKFKHSLNLYSSIAVGAANESFPADFKPADKVSLVLVLVIKDHEPQWCKPVKTKLLKTLPPYLKKIWKPKVYVINHITATEQRLTTQCNKGK